MVLPRIAITPGDPAGIGPEIVTKALLRSSFQKSFKPIIVGEKRFFNELKQAALPVEFVDVPLESLSQTVPGKYSAATGKHSYEIIRRAVELIENGHADALVTAPVSKAAMYLAGVHYPGQTELLGDITGTKKYVMVMASGNIITAMATRHLAINDISKELTLNKITDLVKVVAPFVKKAYHIKNPRICISSLNPHAGEDGLLGKEERTVIIPAVNILKNEGFEVWGPLPPDSAWVKTLKGGFDVLVTMYHDQAMIGLKCVAPDKIVNITAGLPFVRTSPGHGTAFDIAGKNAADPTPMIEAMHCAATLYVNMKSSN